MGGACCTYGRDEKHNILAWKPERKRPPERHRHTWKNSIKMNLKESVCDNVKQVYLTQDRIQCQAYVNTVMNLQIP
jgi:hypothetical protein